MWFDFMFYIYLFFSDVQRWSKYTLMLLDLLELTLICPAKHLEPATTPSTDIISSECLF